MKLTKIKRKVIEIIESLEERSLLALLIFSFSLALLSSLLVFSAIVGLIL